MCGIIGYMGKYSPAELNGGLMAIAHRGPDDSGQYFDESGNIGLAHARLSILDLSPLGHQPMLNSDESLVIVFNGEIYNYLELRGELQLSGFVFRGHSDTEVLLALYQVYGEGMMSMLNGIFAFAVYDVANKTLLLACDSMAVKPVYFCDDGKGVTFASELRGLIALGGTGQEINLSCLYSMLGFLWSPGGATQLKGVYRLGPGEAIRITDCQIERRWTWAPNTWNVVKGKKSLINQDVAIREVQSKLRTAVHKQLLSDVPVGAFLSGGLDSSAVVALAKEVQPRIECFTINTGDAEDTGVTQDLPYARMVAKHLGVALHEITIDSARMAGDLENMIIHLDEPIADPASLNVLYIARLARERGVKVLLSGVGGDDLFSGYRRHQALMHEDYWTWLPPRLLSYFGDITRHMDQGGAFWRRVAKIFANASLPADERLISYFLWSDPLTICNLFRPEYRKEMQDKKMTEPLESYLASLPAGLSRLDNMLALEQRFFLPDHNLLYTDRMSMAVGVEVRVPFLDNDLVQFANSLPDNFKVRGTTGKWILKKAMEPYLPRSVVYRPKTGFGAPLRRWLRHELREWVSDNLSVDTIRRRGIFDPSAVIRLVEDDRAGRVDAAYTIFGLVCIEVWCRNFIDNRISRAAST